MKRRVSQQLLKWHQARTVNKVHPVASMLNSFSYQLIADMMMDVKRPFTRVCIHGREPQLMLPYIKEHNGKFGQKKCTITVVDYVRCLAMEGLIEKEKSVKEIRYVQNGDSWLPEEDEFDLLVSSLRTHHANDPQTLFTKYEKTLKPDGALIGTAFVEGTLRQLYWAYLMAQNERYGGVSPKVTHFPGLGETGTYLTSSKYELCTILQHEKSLQFQSFVDILTVLQEMGESGWLRGRRKAVFEDLLLSAAALYESEFRTERDTVTASFSMSKFIGWKHHPSQPKKLRPGKQVGSVEFSDELRKYGDVEDYTVREDSEDPIKIK